MFDGEMGVKATSIISTQSSGRSCEPHDQHTCDVEEATKEFVSEVTGGKLFRLSTASAAFNNGACPFTIGRCIYHFQKSHR
jgi:hypothetical protein